MSHDVHFVPRILAVGLSAVSAAAMLYIGLYQSRVVERLWCPVLGRGCEAVADASFARPFGIPDGYIGAVLYALIVVLLLVHAGQRWASVALLALAVFAVVANAVGVYDMARLGAFCFYCLVTTAASPVLLWALWQLP
jgi:uncharacterized membrane protein